jgi:hypothetical protein
MHAAADLAAIALLVVFAAHTVQALCPSAALNDPAGQGLAAAPSAPK